MPPTAAPWTAWPRLLAEDLVAVPEPLPLALAAGAHTAPAPVIARAARALLDLPEVEPQPPPWLAPHQIPALNRLRAIVARHGGALLADAVGLGKSYIALALALEMKQPLTLVVPAVLVGQWQRLVEEKGARAEILTHEVLSRPSFPLSHGLALGVTTATPLIVVDEAHRFRNPETRRYRALAHLCIGRPVLLVTATPVHNRLGDLFHLFRLFLRDDALTALGIGSLARAARGEYDPAALRAVTARLVVARSRARLDAAAFPRRVPGTVLRVGAAPAPAIARLVAGVERLEIAGRAAALLRLMLLRRLASSTAAFRATLSRYRAFVELVAQAGADGRRLGATEFQRLFPPGEGQDVQLALLPLLLEPGIPTAASPDLATLDQLDCWSRVEHDPKADRLDRLLADGRGKTIVFTDARATARHLLKRLGPRHRVAAVTGASGWFGTERASPQEVLATFAPLAQGAAAPPQALQTDVLIATDLVSEGLNLQDAVRVIHYDLPWSPARLAQRVGRIDRLGSLHDVIATVSFLPPLALARAVGLERRLSAKLLRQIAAGAAQRETTAGVPGRDAPLDWCDRLQVLARPVAAAPGTWTHVAGSCDAMVLVVRVGAVAEAIVVEHGVASADPERATRILEAAATTPPLEQGRDGLEAALHAAAPLLRARFAVMQSARWRAEDRDRLARRLIPWVLTAARRAARSGDAPLLARLDQLVTRLTLGMTAGEELSLRKLVEQRMSLEVRDLLAWHERLPLTTPELDKTSIQLVAAVVTHHAPRTTPLDSFACSPRSSSISTAPSSTPST